MQTILQRRARDRKRKNEYFTDPKNRAIKQQRDRDRYNYVKTNGKIPKGKELDHAQGYGKGRKQVISKSVNRAKGAKTSAIVRRRK